MGLDELIGSECSRVDSLKELVACNKRLYCNTVAAMSGIAGGTLASLVDIMDNPYTATLTAITSALAGGAFAYVTSNPWKRFRKAKNQIVEWISKNKAMTALIGGSISGGYGAITSAFMTYTEGTRFTYPTEAFFPVTDHYSLIAHAFITGTICAGAAANLVKTVFSGRPLVILEPSDNDNYNEHMKTRLRTHISFVNDDLLSRWNLMRFELVSGNQDAVLEEMSELFSLEDLGDKSRVAKAVGKYDSKPGDSGLVNIIKQYIAGNDVRTVLEWQDLLNSLEGVDLMKHTFCYAQFLDSTGRQNLADEQWARGVGWLMGADNFSENLYESGRGRHKVLSHKDSFIGGYLRFKVSGPDHFQTLKDEFANIEYFREVIGASIVEPVRLVDSGMYRFLITRDAGKVTLLDAMSTATPIEQVVYVEESMELLASIHEVGRLGGRSRSLAVSPPDEHFFIVRAIAKLPLLQEYCDRFRDAYMLMNSMLEQITPMYYKDHNPKNVVVNRYGELVAIDFESRMLLPPQLDLISALEFSRGMVSPRLVAYAIDTYIKKREELSGESIDRVRFQKEYNICGVQRHIELAGYRTRDQNWYGEDNSEWVRWHIMNAAEHSRRLCSNLDTSQGLEILCVAECLDSLV